MENIENQNVEVKKEEGGYFGYYIFVFISAIIGFILVFFSTRWVIDELKNKGVTDFVNSKMLISVTVSVIAVIIFMFIALGLKKIFKKIFLSEVFLYIYIGFMTTMISLISFKLLNDKLNPTGTKDSLGWMVAEILAFIIAVTFSFFADKLVVFKSYSFVPTRLFAEFGLFISARLITEGINIVLMYIVINVMKQEAMVGKIVSSVVVIVLNYLFSKFIIFKKKKIVVEVSDNEIKINSEEKTNEEEKISEKEKIIINDIDNIKVESENNG